MTACLHLVTDRDRRGAQVHAMDLAAGLERWGQDTEVVALAPGQHGDLLDIEALGPWRRSPATLRELRQRAADVDVVVAHGSATLSACVLGLAGISTPFVYRQISDPLFWAGSLARRSRVGAMIRRASRVGMYFTYLFGDETDVFPGFFRRQESLFRPHRRHRADNRNQEYY